jgi:hypothetical protein
MHRACKHVFLSLSGVPVIVPAEPIFAVVLLRLLVSSVSNGNENVSFLFLRDGSRRLILIMPSFSCSLELLIGSSGYEDIPPIDMAPKM